MRRLVYPMHTKGPGPEEQIHSALVEVVRRVSHRSLPLHERRHRELPDGWVVVKVNRRRRADEELEDAAQYELVPVVPGFVHLDSLQQEHDQQDDQDKDEHPPDFHYGVAVCGVSEPR